MENLIYTNKSFLKLYNINILEDINFLSLIKEIENKLIKYPKIKIFNKEATQHRCIGFFSNESIGYYYSGQLAKSQPLENNLLKLLEIINNKFTADFNGILINKYKDGNDYIGKHSDDEKNLGNIGVISISYGGTRKFRIRNKNGKRIMDINLESGSIIQMGGDFQKEFTHEIPIEKKVKSERYSFTFRKHLI